MIEVGSIFELTALYDSTMSAEIRLASQDADFRADGTRICSMAAALSLVGDRWSLQILREIGMGVTRFDEIQRHTGAPRQMLTARLRKLEEVGIIVRESYSDRPPRFDYHLSTAGHDLIPVMAGLRQWGEVHAI